MDSGNGGAINYVCGTLTLSGCIFERCHSSGYGGAFCALGEGDVTVDGNQFEECTSGSDGGALYIVRAGATVTFNNNNVIGCSGAASASSVYILWEVNYEMTGCNFSSEAEEKECIVKIVTNSVPSQARFASCRFEGNGKSVGQRFLDPGSLSFMQQSSGISFDKCCFGDLVCESESGGGAIYRTALEGLGDSSVSITQCEFINVMCTGNGSAVCVTDCMGSVTISNSYFESCASQTGTGGALYLGSEIYESCTVNNCRFLDNSAGLFIINIFFNIIPGGHGINWVFKKVSMQRE